MAQHIPDTVKRSARAVAAWRLLVKRLTAAGRWRPEFAYALEGLVTTYAKFLEAEERLSDPELPEAQVRRVARRNTAYINPWVVVRQMHLNAMRPYIRMFGLSPADAKRLEEELTEPKSDLRKFLSGPAEDEDDDA